MHLRLRLVQPESPDPMAVIILPYLIPHKPSGLRVHGIDKSLLPVKIKGAELSVLRAHQHISLVHLTVVLAGGIDGGPDGYHRMNAHLLQFPAHGLRVRPVPGIKLPLPLLGPVKIVNDDGVDGNPSPLVLPGHLQQILLALIAKPALPEARRPAGKPGRVAGQVAVSLHGPGGRLPRIDKIVRLVSAVRHKHSVVAGGLAAPRGRIVPEEAVAQGGVQHRQRGLGIVMDNLAGAALAVKQILLLLPHAVKMFPFVGVKDHPDLIMIPLHMHIAVGVIPLKPGAQNLFSLAVVSDDPAVPGVSRLYGGADHTVYDGGLVLVP